MFETKRIVTTVSKRELGICLPFLGKESLKIGNRSKLAKPYFRNVYYRLFSVARTELEIILVSETKYR